MELNEKTPSARRSKRQRQRKKQGSYKIFIFCLILFALGTVITLSLTVFFQITEIRVEGNEHYPDEEVTAAAGIAPGENLFRIDKGKAAARITGQLPYIYKTRILRRLPSVVLIEVTESSPVAVLRGGENEVLLDIFGRALEVVPVGSEGNFPEVIGADANDIYLGQAVFEKADTLKNYTLLTEELSKAGLLSKVNRMDLGVPYDLTFTYEDRILITLGDLSDIEGKIASFSLLLSEKIGEAEEGELDLTNPDEVHFIPQE